MKQPLFSPSESDLIKKESTKAEHSGRLTENQISVLQKKRLFHAAVPADLGGAQLSVQSQMNLFEEASRIDGSFGWTLTLGAGAGIFGAFMEPELAREVFEAPGAFITGSGYPAGIAIPWNEQYTVSGKWKYASGTPHATLFTASCVIKNEAADDPEIRALAFYPEQVKSLNNWNSYGLKATASHDFEVSDVQIPHKRSFTMDPKPAYENFELYRFPFMPYAAATLASSMYGITLGFIDEVQSILQADIPGEKVLISYNNVLHESVDKLWENLRKGNENHWELITEVNNAAKNLAGQCRETSLILYTKSGMSVLNESSRANRFWRDLMTAGQHVMLRYEGNNANY